MRLSDLVLAYRQAKISLYYDRRGVGMVRLARYEEDLERNLRRLLDARIGTTWFDAIDVGEVYLAPKARQPATETSEKAEKIVEIGLSTQPYDVATRVQLAPSPDFAIVEVLYLWEFGHAFESLLSGDVVGYRLKRQGNAINRTGRHLFNFWPRAFERYRDEPLEMATRILAGKGPNSDRPRACTVTTLDFTSFFDATDPGLLLAPDLITRLTAGAAGLGLPFNQRRYAAATRSLLRAFRRIYQLRAEIVGGTKEIGLPIGALTSRVIANVVLAEFDARLAKAPGVAMYRRYVDDLIVVRQDDRGSAIVRDVPTYLESWVPGFSVDGGDVYSVVTGEGPQVFHIQRSKTRVHHLRGPGGVEFLKAVRTTFAAVASERRAFAPDLEAPVDEFEAIGETEVNPARRLVALRDADPEVLTRFTSGGYFILLERSIRLLSAHEASKLLEQHEEKLLSSLEHACAWVDVDLMVRVLRIALLARPTRLSGRLLKLLGDATSTSASDARLRQITWNGQELDRGTALLSLKAYVYGRLREAIATSCGFVEHDVDTLGLGEAARTFTAAALIAEARALRRADLRYLDREDDCSVHAGAASERPEISPLQVALLRSPSLRGRLRLIADFAAAVEAAGDEAWALPPIALLLSTRPPSYFDVAQRLARRKGERGYSGKTFELIRATVNALSGSSYSRAIATAELDTISISGVAGEHAAETRLILGNLVLDETWWCGAATPGKGPFGRPVLSHARFMGLANVVDAARHAARRRRGGGEIPPAILVLPELSVPRQWFRELGRYISRDERVGLVVGLEYFHEDPPGRVLNQAFGVFPCGFDSVAVVPWTKRHPAHEERKALRERGLRLRTTKRSRRTVVETRYGRISVLICSELLEPQAHAGLVGRVELLAVPAWNKDTESFSHMIKSAGLLIHSYVGVANNGYYSDCRGWAPIKAPPYRREVCRLVQRHIDTVVWDDLLTERLRTFHDGVGSASETDSQEPIEWRPLPPSWPDSDD